jgi:hypothetical protein
MARKVSAETRQDLPQAVRERYRGSLKDETRLIVRRGCLRIRPSRWVRPQVEWRHPLSLGTRSVEFAEHRFIYPGAR